MPAWNTTAPHPATLSLEPSIVRAYQDAVLTLHQPPYSPCQRTSRVWTCNVRPCAAWTGHTNPPPFIGKCTYLFTCERACLFETSGFLVSGLSCPLPMALFLHRFLAGTARWESRLRAGGIAGFCFVRQLTDTLRVCGSLKKQNTKRSFLAPPQKAALGLASRPRSPFCAPREKSADEEKKQMNEQIQRTNQGQFNG